MSQFYKLNLAASLQTGIIIRIVVIWILVGVFLGAAMQYGIWLHKEYNRPVVRTRLEKLDLWAVPVCELKDEWEAGIKEYKPLHPLMQKQDERPLEETLTAFDAFTKAFDSTANSAPRYGIKPLKLTAVRDRSVKFTFSLPLPDTGKDSYRDSANKFLSEAMDIVSNPSNGFGVVCTKSWAKAKELAASDAEVEGEIVFSFEASRRKTLEFPSVPKDLVEAVKSIDSWKSNVLAHVIPGSSKDKPQKIGQKIEQIGTIGSNNADIGKLRKYSVDPETLFKALKALPEIKAEAVGQINSVEEDWLKIAEARWPYKRSKALDTPKLDEDAEYIEQVGRECPKVTDIRKIFEKSFEFNHSVTGGITRTLIHGENTFVNKILLPAFTRGLPVGSGVKLLGDVNVSQANLVDFPSWTVSVSLSGDGSVDRQQAVKPISVDKMIGVIGNVDGNSTGLWITSLTAAFADGVVSSEFWPGIKAFEVSGRVPCWTEKDTKETKK